MKRSLYRKATPAELARAGLPVIPAAEPAPIAVPARKRGRPATGQTPHKDRLAKSRAKLADQGGRRLDVSLSPDSVSALADIRAIEGFGTDREAVEDALKHRASLLRRRAKITGRKP